jgi:hypothetical protein
MLRLSIWLAAGALAAGSGVAAPAPASATEAAKLECKTGPAKRRYGGTLWLVYACNDGRSLAFRPDQNNPNNTAKFVLRWTGAQYELEGDPGDKPEIAERAYDEIADMTERQISSLIAAAKSAD